MPIQMQQREWRDYRDALLPIIQQTEERNQHEFSKEIDDALSDERAFLFSSLDGFLVLEPRSHKGIPELHILFAYNVGCNAIARYQKDIELLARQIGARSITTQTKVKALAPYFEQQGFKLERETLGVTFWRLTL